MGLKALAHWLEHGAPHVVFDMTQGMTLPDEPEHLREAAQKGCGTVCCIAGYAALLDGYERPTDAYPDLDWEPLRDQALNALGLPNNGEWYGHDLFDNELAPHNCTPTQAAAAVRRVIAGKEPWT